MRERGRGGTTGVKAKPFYRQLDPCRPSIGFRVFSTAEEFHFKSFPSEIPALLRATVCSKEAIFDNDERQGGTTRSVVLCRSYKYVNKMCARPRLTALTYRLFICRAEHARDRKCRFCRRLPYFARCTKRCVTIYYILPNSYTRSIRARFCTPRNRFRIVHYAQFCRQGCKIYERLKKYLRKTALSL